MRNRAERRRGFNRIKKYVSMTWANWKEYNDPIPKQMPYINPNKAR